MASHRLAELYEIRCREAFPRQRNNDRVFPRNMPPIALEEAPQHIPDHLGVVQSSSCAQMLEALEQFGCKALIGCVFESQSCQNVVDIVDWQGALLNQRKQAKFFVAMVKGHFMLQRPDG